MKNIFKTLLFSLLATFALVSCNKDDEIKKPAASTQADFSYTVSNDGYFPCTVTFTNKSLNANSYSWNFGNGTTSTEVNPAVTFDTPGVYTITLTCTGDNSVYYNNLTKTIQVIVKDPNAGKTHVMYYTTRSSTGGDVWMVILDGNNPVPQRFNATQLERPYGIAVDTATKKVFVADYYNERIVRYDADGKNETVILDAAVPGQEIVGSPQGIIVIKDKLYFGSPNGIYRCNFDGTSPEKFINLESTGASYPLDLYYVASTKTFYFANDKTDYEGGLFKVNFDGTGLTKIIPDIDNTAIEVDTVNNKIYAVTYSQDGTLFSENGVYMMNLDGSGVTKIGDFGAKATWGIALDQKEKNLYWSFKTSNENPDGKIIRSNPDGSGQTDWLTGASPHAMIITDIKL